MEGSADYERGFRGAFVTVLARCATREQFVEIVTEHVRREGFEVVRGERLEPLSSGHLELNELVMELAVKTREYPVQWSTFHTFKSN